MSNLRSTRKDDFDRRHGKDAADKYRATTKQYAMQLQKRDRLKRLVVNPKSHQSLAIWDAVTTLALVYTALLTPFEATFLPASSALAPWADFWFLANRLLDVIFLLDMVLQFFLAYEESDSHGTRVLVDDHRKIIRHYVTTWFALDAITVLLPSGFDVYQASLYDASGDGTNESAVSNLTLLRVLRCVRLTKLLRLLRSSRIFQRWKSRITLTYGQITTLQCIILLLLSSHWFACIMGLDASLHASPQQTWLGEDMFGICDATDDTNASSGKTSVTGCGSLSVLHFYIAAFVWAVMIITGTGGTDPYPSENSTAENLVVGALVLAGALLWTQVLALFYDVVANSDPGITAHRQQLDSLNRFAAKNNLPKVLANRMREYVHQQKEVHLEDYAAKSLPGLSPALHIEVVLHCHRRWLDSIWFLHGVEEMCLVSLALAMVSDVLAPHEMASMGRLYVIQRGLVLYGGHILTDRMSWGADDVLLTDTRYLSKRTARAMTYTNVQLLTREALEETLASFPASKLIVRKCLLKLVVRRHLIDRARQDKKRGLDMTAQSSVDFVDRVHAAASSATPEQIRSVNLACQFVDNGKKFQGARRFTATVLSGTMQASPNPMAEMRADIHAETQNALRVFQEEVREEMRASRKVMESLRATLTRVEGLMDHRGPGGGGGSSQCSRQFTVRGGGHNFTGLIVHRPGGRKRERP